MEFYPVNFRGCSREHHSVHLFHGFLVPLKFHAAVALIAAEGKIERRVTILESGEAGTSQIFTESAMDNA